MVLLLAGMFIICFLFYLFTTGYRYHYPVQSRKACLKNTGNKSSQYFYSIDCNDLMFYNN